MTLRIAIVGAGPAGLYAAGHLLDCRDLPVEVDFIERLPTPWGLIRSGVAPDHAEKKMITDRLFDFTLRDRRVRFFGNVEVGKDVTPAELSSWYDGVIYAHGARSHNSLGIPGEDLDGVWGAREFVQFYNAHPDQARLQFDLSHPRAVIIGNGNVALDIARILTSDISVLERTDIAEHALEALRTSKIREVVVMGRRGIHHAAFNNPELEEFAHSAGVDFSVRGNLEPACPVADPLEVWRAQRRAQIIRELVSRPHSPGNRRVVFQFLAVPTALRGERRIEQVEYALNRPLRRGDEEYYQTSDVIETLEAGFVLSACGYRGAPLPGLAFEPKAGIVPNDKGRVVEGGAGRPGTYVTGWIKRGCRGIIGSNRRCALETVTSLIDDFKSGLLQGPVPDRTQVEDLLAQRNNRIVCYDNWRSIDREERLAGRKAGRPRIKIASFDGMVDAAFATPVAFGSDPEEELRG